MGNGESFKFRLLIKSMGFKRIPTVVVIMDFRFVEHLINDDNATTPKIVM